MDWRVMVVLLTICILGMTPSSINGDTDPADASALNSMYTSLNSASQLTHWSSDGNDPCGQSWKGVTCTGNRVTEIKLPGLQLSGSLGYQLDKLTSVTKLDVSDNNIGGAIPYQLPPNLQNLNLASNQFTGSIPYSISTMTSLKKLNIAHNQLDNLGDFFEKLTSLIVLDLSSNRLTGNLPQSFSSLSSMTSMYLQNNNFTGPINVLANLPLENLNIANNQFTGWIPEQLKNINLHKDGNEFSSGPAPPPPPGTPPATRPDRNHPPSGNSPSNSDAGSSGKKSGIGAGGVAGIVISILVVGAIVAFFLFKKRSKRPSSDIEKLHDQPFSPLASNDVREMKAMQNSSTVTPASVNLKPPPIDRQKSFDEEEFSTEPLVFKKSTNAAPLNVTSYSIADLQVATSSFSIENLVGEGSFGPIYQAQFDDGKVLAVKKIDSSALPHELSVDFTEIVSDISRLHHPNVTELKGYCSEHGMHLLVYEFHKNGSLHDFLHLSNEHSKPLTWNSRVKIALGTARALEYLHEVCSPSIVHKNIKSANILLDSELNPHLSDSGLASFIPNADQDQNAGSGYSAPEVAMSGQYNMKSDVYSFGVVMLELISGRKPFDSSRPRSEQSLVRWATPQLHDIDALSKMVDPELEGLYPIKSLSRFADVIALCVQPEPEFRPPMSEVVEALVRLMQRTNMSKRTTGGSDQGASRAADDGDTYDYMS